MTGPRRAAWAACAASAAMVVFGLAAHTPSLAGLRFAALAAAATALAWSVASAPRPRRVLGLEPFRPLRLCWVPACIAFGAVLACWYRHAAGRPLTPGGLAWFALPAVAIGAGEELLYRGFVQGGFRRFGFFGACLLAAGAHTAYKCSLFAVPGANPHANLLVLAIGTLVVGVLLGLMRQRLGSLVFPAAAHVAFDLVAYGDLSSAPWWVW